MARSTPPLDRSGKDSKDKDGPVPPETVAVALTYKAETTDQGPVVSASGYGYLAERIIELAKGLNIPIRSDVDLVEILAATDVGQEIPVEAFIAVAEILRYVYALNGRMLPKPPEK